MNLRRAIGGIVLSFIFLLVIFFALQGIWGLSHEKGLFLGSVSGGAPDPEPVVLVKEPKPPVPYRNWDIPELDLAAESGIAVETKISGADKILFKKNSYLKLPIASLTKLMTAVIAFENYNLSDKIIISEDASLQEGDLNPLNPDSIMTVNDLLYIMLIQSSNKAAYALAEGMNFEQDKKFVSLMNKKARELGMEETFFEDPTGLSPENVSTADDLIKLAEYILEKHPEIANISKIKEYDLPNYGKLTTTDQLLGEIPDIVAGKTGFTVEAKGTLLLLIDNSKNNDYLIYIILGADDRFAEMKKMIEWVNAAYSW